MSRLNATLARGWGRLGPRFLPFADAATPELPLGRAAAAVAVPGLGRHGDGAAQRHAQPGDDRRARRADLAGRADGLAAAGVRPVARADRLPLGHTTARCWAGGGCPISGSARCCSSAASPSCRSRCWSCPATATARRSTAQVGAALAFLLVGAGLHTTQTAGLALATDLAPAECPAARRGAALRHAAGRHGGQRPRVRRAAGRLQPHRADPGDPGRGACHHGPEPDRAVEAGGARPRRAPHPIAPRPAFGAILARASSAAAAPAGCWSRSGWAPPPSACRTSCWSPMAAQILHLVGRGDDRAHRPARRRQPDRLRAGRPRCWAAAATPTGSPAAAPLAGLARVRRRDPGRPVRVTAAVPGRHRC